MRFRVNPVWAYFLKKRINCIYELKKKAVKPSWSKKYLTYFGGLATLPGINFFGDFCGKNRERDG
jgi:hypothetical protein